MSEPLEPGSPYPQPPAAPEGHLSAEHLPLTPTASAPVRPPRHRRLLLAVLALMAGSFLLGGTGAAIGLVAERLHPPAPAAEAPIPLFPQPPGAGVTGDGGTGTAGSASAQSIAARVAPAIVDINTVIQGVAQSGQAAGTGMILTSGGEVLTNNHVIQGASSISVAIAGRSGSYDARVIGADPTRDVALLQVQGVSGLPAVKLADSSTLTVGQHVVAVGNAFGRGGAPSVTEGTITALDQSITASDGPGSANSEQLSGMIQTDASISPGDSGGALVNDSGQVVGMITAGQTRGLRRATTTGVGFAITATNAAAVVNEIRSGGSGSTIVLGQPAFLGVSVTDLDAATAARLGLGAGSGALVTGVVAGSPAEGIGIGRNAVITEVGGRRVTSAASLGPAIHAFKPGQAASVTWVDAGGSHTARATLVAGPAA